MTTAPTRPDRLITAAELAVRWRVSRSTVYNLLHRGLPSVQVARCRRFDPADADAWLVEQSDAR